MVIDHSYIQYAYTKEKGRVSIFDVPTGKNCGCFCRICGEALGAKNISHRLRGLEMESLKLL